MGWGNYGTCMVMDLGEKHIRGLQNLSRLMSHHRQGEKPCLTCEMSLDGGTVLQHVLKVHWKSLGLDFGEKVLRRLGDLELNFVYVF